MCQYTGGHCKVQTGDVVKLKKSPKPPQSDHSHNANVLLTIVGLAPAVERWLLTPEVAQLPLPLATSLPRLLQCKPAT